MLVYSVECGLKYLLLDKWNEENPQVILDSEDNRRKKILKTHNLEKILKELGQQGNFNFPLLKTVHKDMVTSETYHQLYRYCIRTQDEQRTGEEHVEETLYNVACWIAERM